MRGFSSSAVTTFERGHYDAHLGRIQRLEVPRVERQQRRCPCADRALCNDRIVGAPAGEPVPGGPLQQRTVTFRIERNHLGTVDEIAFEQRKRVGGSSPAARWASTE